MDREVIVPREKPTTDVLLNGYVVNVAGKSLFMLIDFINLSQGGIFPNQEQGMHSK